MIPMFMRGLLGAFVLALAGCGGGSNTCVDVTGGNACSGSGGTGGGATPTAADLVVVLSSASLPNDGSQTVLATVTAIDANRSVVAGLPVTISVNNGGVVTPGGEVTSAGGILTAAIGIGSDSSNRTMTVTAKSGSISRTATIDVRDAAFGGVTGPTVTISLSSTVVTPLAPATATLTVRSANGSPISGVVVGLTTSRGNLATLSAESALTNAAGVGTVTLSAASGGSSGADELTAVANLGTTTVSGIAGFTVSSSAPTLTVNVSSTTLRASAPPATVTATVRDSANRPVERAIVNFSSSAGKLSFGAASALTNASGVATTTVAPVNSQSSAADQVVASTAVSGQSLQSVFGVEIQREVGTVSLSLLPSSAVSAAAPVTVRAQLLTAAGTPVAQGTVVAFTTQFNLGVFDAQTAATDASGLASVVVSPRTTSSSGADVLVATATINGLVTTGSAVAQFTSSAPSGTPLLQLDLSPESISALIPATASARLTDAKGNPVPGQVVTFASLRGVARTNVATALTDINGRAAVVVSPATATSAGADELRATASYAGVDLQATKGFEVRPTNVSIVSFTGPSAALTAYGQTPLTLVLSGASVTSPVSMNVTSSCISQGKASISPASFSATTSSVTLQYRDNGCGAVQTSDQLQAVVAGTAISQSLTLPIDKPLETSLAFVAASPEVIFLKGSGLTESSIVTFEARDSAGNQLPGKIVELRLLTGAGGVTMEGRSVESVEPPSANPFTQESNALGRVSVRVNSGTLPTPVRVHAKIQGTAIATVSSNLNVAVGLPSQLNFSLSQGTRNIEGFNIDGTVNTYQIIAADRSGNPVPAGTSINFVAEGGQIEGIKQTQLVSGLARTTANFVSAEPRPVDGRVTITAYALGEESFLDANGNNAYDLNELFQDLGNVFRDRNFDGRYSDTVDEFIPLKVNNSSACAVAGNDLLRLDASIPSVSIANGSAADTCDNKWSGAGQVYVRRALETVLSTSAARPLWANTSGLDATCQALEMQVGPNVGNRATFAVASGDTWYGGTSGTLSLIVADANPGDVSQGRSPRLNPMAAGTVITATTPNSGLTVTVGGGSPVASTTEATRAAIGYEFTAGSSGVVFVNFRSPSGTVTTSAINVQVGARPSVCTLPP